MSSFVVAAVWWQLEVIVDCACVKRVHPLVALSGAMSVSVKDPDKDERKLAFTLKALETADPFVKETTTPPDVLKAMHWQSGKTPKEVVQARENIISKLESAGSAMWSSGLCNNWLKDCCARSFQDN